MTAYPAWTPASRPGIVPLHPLTFGTILGRSFAALRQNPRVLLGFALCVQAVAYLVVIAVVGAVALASFSRLDTLQEGTEEFQAVLAGSIAITAVTGIVLGLSAAALGVIVQGVVVSEVAHAVVAEKLTLGALWLKVRPVVWRLVGYSFLVLLVVVALVAAAVFGLFGIAAVAPPAAVGVGIVAVLAAIPLVWWLMVKLLVVPSVIILEQAAIGRAVRRSWHLTRGRFWSTLGILLLLNLIFGGIAQVVSIPFSFVSIALSTIVAPTGDAQTGQVITLIVSGVLSQAVILLIQAVAVVVQSTATALIYIDCRMRHEGLDLDLLGYVEQRDAGAVGLTDPYREHIGREVQARPGYPVPPAVGGYPAPGYATPPFQTSGGYPTTVPAYAWYPPPQPYDAGTAPTGGSVTAPAAQAAQPQPAPESAPGPTQWAPPGEPADPADRESPWR